MSLLTFRNVKIIGTGMYVPEKILTNQELETELGESIDDFVSNNIGIKTRRIAKEEETTASMSIEAAKMAS